MSWEDRVTDEQYEKIEAAQNKLISKAEKGRVTRTDEHVAYGVFTNNGMTCEEADEMVNICIQG